MLRGNYFDFAEGENVLANRHPSVLKRDRQNKKRRERNRTVRSRVRTETRKLREAVTKEDAPAADAELRVVVRELTKAGSKGVLHRNTVSRRVSRLSKQVAALKKQAAG
jgi:small subunit ribosomal protein S20